MNDGGGGGAAGPLARKTLEQEIHLMTTCTCTRTEDAGWLQRGSKAEVEVQELSGRNSSQFRAALGRPHDC